MARDPINWRRFTAVEQRRERRNYNAGGLQAAPKKLGRKLWRYLRGVTIGRQAINEQLPPFLHSVDGLALEIGRSGEDYRPHLRAEQVTIDLLDHVDNTVTGDARRLPFAADSFGAVICVSTLEHTASPRAILAEAYRCLRPGGGLFLTVPWLFEGHMAPNDFYRFSYAVMGEWLDESGFEVERFEPVNGWPGCVSHFLQASAIARPLGSMFLAVDGLVGKPSFVWTTQINLLARKPGSPGGATRSALWPSRLRCPACVDDDDRGILRETQGGLQCVDCLTVYEQRDGGRPIFPEETPSEH